jgi:probable rRNA maturation factor
MMVMMADLLLDIHDDHCLLPEQEFLHTAYEVFCRIMGYTEGARVDLVLCLPSELQEVNKRFRGVDKPTDVISFPHPADLGENLTGKTLEHYLGEILIDTNYIARQTDSQDLNADITQVFIHGLLHLCGYDHLNSIQKRNMQELEIKILSGLRQEG